MKRYIDNGIKCYSDFFLLPKSFIAITLFGRIFFRMKSEKLEDYLKSSAGKTTINHERIHTLQAKTFKTRYLGFYILYLVYWIAGIFKHGISGHKSYYNIPFEKEAYANENDFGYSLSNWKQYR